MKNIGLILAFCFKGYVRLPLCSNINTGMKITYRIEKEMYCDSLKVRASFALSWSILHKQAIVDK